MSPVMVVAACLALVAVGIAASVVMRTNRWPHFHVSYQCASCPRRFDSLGALVYHESREHYGDHADDDYGQDI